MRKRLLLLLTLLTLLTLFVSVARAADSYDISWHVIGGGGGGPVSAGVYTLDGTIGQPVTWTVSNGAYEHCAGFWCTVNNFFGIFLPIIRR